MSYLESTAVSMMTKFELYQCNGYPSTKTDFSLTRCVASSPTLSDSKKRIFGLDWFWCRRLELSLTTEANIISNANKLEWRKEKELVSQKLVTEKFPFLASTFGNFF